MNNKKREINNVPECSIAYGIIIIPTPPVFANNRKNAVIDEILLPIILYFEIFSFSSSISLFYYVSVVGTI